MVLTMFVEHVKCVVSEIVAGMWLYVYIKYLFMDENACTSFSCHFCNVYTCLIALSQSLKMSEIIYSGLHHSTTVVKYLEHILLLMKICLMMMM